MDRDEAATAVVDDALIETFRSITSSSRDEASFFLESHQGDLNAAVSTFFDSGAAPPPAAFAADPLPSPSNSPSHSESPDDSKSASLSPSRSRSLSPPVSRDGAYNLRSRQVAPPGNSASLSKRKAASSSARAGGIRTLSDLNKMAEGGSDDSDSDEGQEYYTGGEKSGMLVQDPRKGHDVDTLFNQARQSGAVVGPSDLPHSSSSSRSFTGTGRLLSGEAVPAAPPRQPEVVNHSVTFWTNGFSVDDGPLRRLDDPENASFLESIKNSECPRELEPADRNTKVHCELLRRNEKYPEAVKRRAVFQGVGRTLGSSNNETQESSAPTIAAAPLSAAPQPSMGLVVDNTLPTTSIQLRLADGTRMVSRFNLHHTVRDIRSFIDASRPGGSRAYQLQCMGFPPKQLTDETETIEHAGLASSVIIQRS